ncbi:MAG: hypothetical protein NTV51_25380 [Verrucomicrobia bacterium]|nr:hypothetical protein [Verrucomicrobiota bacterium]
MSPAPATPPPAPPTARPRTGAYLGVAALVLLGTALFATAAVAQVRRKENAPPATVLGLPAWQIAAAGFVSTLAGGLWLRRLV